MDPVFGVTVYLEPDFDVLTAMRSFDIPRQLRNPHPAVVEFQSKKALVSKAEIGRAARFLQGLISAAGEVGWKVPPKTRDWSRGRDEPVPDLSLQLPSRELFLTLRELDERGRRVQAYVTETDYYTRGTRTQLRTRIFKRRANWKSRSPRFGKTKRFCPYVTPPIIARREVAHADPQTRDRRS